MAAIIVTFEDLQHDHSMIDMSAEPDYARRGKGPLDQFGLRQSLRKQSGDGARGGALGCLGRGGRIRNASPPCHQVFGVDKSPACTPMLPPNAKI